MEFKFKPYVPKRGAREELWRDTIRVRKNLAAGESSSCAVGCPNPDYSQKRKEKQERDYQTSN